jgi:hypothetical protein
MPYIKISDPNIIDLTSWHQVINVVNQHSDTISAITNNFGAQGTGVTDWNGATDFAHTFDVGTQQILYGKHKIVVSTLIGAGKITTNSNIIYDSIDYQDANSGAKDFSQKPIITATSQHNSTTIVSDNANVICTIFNVTTTGFSVRLKDARSTESSAVPLTGTFYINWIAIGPK